MEISPSIVPRRWQLEAVEAWAEEQRGIARVVTGGGKTVFAYLCMERFFSRHPDGRAVIVVPTLALLDQWFVDICDATDINDKDVASYSGSSRPEQPARINLVVLNTARRFANDISYSGPTILIVDECHRAGSIENCRALAGFHEATLGLSATPERESDDGFESRIVPALGPIIYAYDYFSAKADKVIVDFELVNIEITLPEEDLNRLSIVRSNATELRRCDANRESSRRLLAGASREIARSASQAIRIPWAVKLGLIHRTERVIFFHERVESLQRIVDLLSRYGQNSVAYHSQFSEAHRRDNLRLFRQGVVNMLVTCRALDEGANVPEANVAIVAHSTSSTRQRIQRLGRVLRPSHGKEHATIYTLYTGAERQAQLVDEASDLEGVAQVVWRRGAIR